ncbi:hypothetical protein U3516DRAFT_752571 [Neocallimastix sp. 'constans']
MSIFITINDVVLIDSDLNVNRYVDTSEDSNIMSGFDEEQDVNISKFLLSLSKKQKAEKKFGMTTTGVFNSIKYD